MDSESKLFLEAYSKFCAFRESDRIDLPILDYDVFKFSGPKPRGVIHGFCLRHSEAFAREIINDVHNIRRFLEDLMSWMKVLDAYAENERFHLVFEFLDDRVVLALGRPAALKERFVYAATKLGQLYARAKIIPEDHTIKEKEMRKWIGNWPSFSKFASNLRALDGKYFRDSSQSFRNFDAHRFPPRIEFGLAPGAGIFLEDGKITYSLDYHSPVQLEQVYQALRGQYPVMLDTLDAFWEMVSLRAKA